MLLVIVILLVVLPVTWLISEFQPRRWIRIVLGISSLVVVFIATQADNLSSRFEYNADYGSASSQLIDAVITNIEAGNHDGLLRELRQLKADFHPTYENRANYDTLVEQFAERCKIESPKDGSEQPSP